MNKTRFIKAICKHIWGLALGPFCQKASADVSSVCIDNRLYMTKLFWSPSSICHLAVRDHVSRLAWEHFSVPPDDGEAVAGEREVWAPLLRLLPL